jgi:PAS domain S-box-containing protein
MNAESKVHHEDEALYKSLVDSLPNPIMIHVKGKVVYANEVILEFTGLSKDEIIGKDLEELLIDPVDVQNSNTLYNQFTNPSLTEEEIEIRTESRRVVLKTFLLRNTRIKYKGKDAVMSILFDITERKNLEKYVLGKVIETEEKERKRFAADLHDDLGPTLSSIKIHLGLLENPKDPEKYAQDLKICKELLTESISKMRIIANNLMPRLIENYGIESALNSFIKIIQREGVFTVDFATNLEGRRFSKQIELNFYRVICELINNTIKHSGATRAVIKVTYADRILKICYTDNGKGYDVKTLDLKTTGMGIGNIRQRVNLVGGIIEFVRKHGKTEVRISKAIDQSDLAGAPT